MNTVPKPERVNLGVPEEKFTTPEEEKPPLHVVDKEVQEEIVAAPKEAKIPFYADMNFWIRVATGLVVLLMVVYYLSLE